MAPYIKLSGARISPSAVQDIINSAWDQLDSEAQAQIIEALDDHDVEYEV